MKMKIEVVKTIPVNKIEAYILDHSFTGPVILSALTLILFGPTPVPAFVKYLSLVLNSLSFCG